MRLIDTSGQRAMVLLVHPADGAMIWPDRAVLSPLPVSSEFMRRAVPDLSDPGTGGVLLGMLAEDGDGCVEVASPDEPGDTWVVCVRWDAPKIEGESLGEACARALLAVWGPA